MIFTAAQSSLRSTRGRLAPRRGIRSRAFVLLLIAAALGALFGGVLRLAWPEAAAASPHTCYVIPLYNTETEDGTHVGVRSKQMTIEDYPVACAEVDSIAVVNSSNDSVEIGTVHIGSAASCSTKNPPGNPYMFEAINVNGFTICDYGPDVVPWTKEDFSVADQYGGYNWTFRYNGNIVPTNLGAATFNNGVVVTNAERHDSDDSAWGNFEENYYMPLDGSWTAWNSSTQCGSGSNGAISNDPTFNNQIWSPANITVSTGSSQNCNY